MSRSTPFLMGSEAESAMTLDTERLALSPEATAVAMDDFRNSRRDKSLIVITLLCIVVDQARIPRCARNDSVLKASQRFTRFNRSRSTFLQAKNFKLGITAKMGAECCALRAFMVNAIWPNRSWDPTLRWTSSIRPR